jgi:two-component system response regulator VanR
LRRILIVEDDPDISELLAAYLREAGYLPMCAEDGLMALDAFRSDDFDLVLLDVMLPKVDGYGVCEIIRRDSKVPVIMLTALDGEQNQLKGYDLDIDDYVTKPFSMPVLLRKISAVLRRAGGSTQQQSDILKYKALSLDLLSYEVSLNGAQVELTQREFEILRELINAPGRVFTREMLLAKLWNYDFLGDERIVDSHIKNLRRKLDADYIETVGGVGYRVPKDVQP